MKKFFVAVLLLFVCVAANADVNSEFVKSAEKYLNSVTGLTGTFVQSEVTVTTKAGESVAYYVYKSATTTSVTSFKNSFNFS